MSSTIAAIIPAMLGTLAVLGVAGSIAVWLGVKHATLGYEDQKGFHSGIQPEPVASTGLPPYVVPPSTFRRTQPRKVKMIGLLSQLWTPKSRRLPMR